MSGDQLQFIDYRKPKLEAGDYQFTTSHRYKGEGAGESGNLNLRVAGERVTIADEVIFSRYPPPNEVGQFADTLPHISFTKGTLPWIRSAYSKDDETQGNEIEIYEPWLFLLVVNEDDFRAGRVREFMPKKVSQLGRGSFFPSAQLSELKSDSSVTGSKTVSSICLQKSLFNDVLLNGRKDGEDKDQLEYLAHVRRRWSETDIVVTLPASSKNTLDDTSLSYDGIRTKLASLNLPETATNLTVVKAGQSWLVQDSVKGDLLLDVVADNGEEVDIQVMMLKRELSVLLANRFAQNASQSEQNDTDEQGGRNIALVISLENYLTVDSLKDIQRLSDTDWMRFIVLTSWEFYSQPVPINFEERSKALDVNALKYEDDTIASMSDFTDSLEAGMVPLPHVFRNNDRALSWYRGPLIPTSDTSQGEYWQEIQLTAEELGQQANSWLATDADKLLRYYPQDGMFDISYAAAYELGRILSLQSSDYLSNLRRYKRARARYIKLNASDSVRLANVQSIGIQINELPYAQLQEPELAAQLAIIQQWLLQLGHLNNIPSWYLVPDKRLLPERSLRTFSLDPQWIQALWLGALSLDGRPEVTNTLFNECWQTLQAKLPRAGAWLRSDIVWAYPEVMVSFRNLDQQALEIEDDKVNLKALALDHFSRVNENIDLAAIKADFEDSFTDLIEMHPAITITDTHTLDSDLALYLAAQPFDYVSLALPPESLHYGADFDNAINQFTKSIQYQGTSITSIGLPMTNEALAVLNVPALAEIIQESLSTYIDAKMDKETDAETKQQQQDYLNSLNQFNSARIGRFMLEGEPKVEFTLGLERGDAA